MTASPFHFDIDKAIEATAVILQEEPHHRMNYMKLLKLITIAERESLEETGTVIVGDNIVALERGPLPSQIYNLIKGEHLQVRQWSHYIERDNYDIELKDIPEPRHLSRYDIEKLQEVSRKYRDKDEWAMVQITHKFPEWIKNEPRDGSSNPIPIEDILEAVNPERAASILNEAKKQRAISDFFEGHSACNEATPSSS